eukprot:1707570-Pleurochrysis_carterae.AAC.2
MHPPRSSMACCAVEVLGLNLGDAPALVLRHDALIGIPPRGVYANALRERIAACAQRSDAAESQRSARGRGRHHHRVELRVRGGRNSRASSSGDAICRIDCATYYSRTSDLEDKICTSQKNP